MIRQKKLAAGTNSSIVVERCQVCAAGFILGWYAEHLRLAHVETFAAQNGTRLGRFVRK